VFFCSVDAREKRGEMRQKKGKKGKIEMRLVDGGEGRRIQSRGGGDEATKNTEKKGKIKNTYWREFRGRRAGGLRRKNVVLRKGLPANPLGRDEAATGYGTPEKSYKNLGLQNLKKRVQGEREKGEIVAGR